MSTNTAPSSAKSITGVLEEEPTNLLNGLSITESIPAASEIAVSPRVSTVGIDEIMMKKDQQPFAHDEGPDYTAPGLDSLHWAGVKKRGDFDQRSIASSMAAERDDKSIYEEPAIGAVEENDDDHDDEHPEEIILPDVTNSLTVESMSLQPSLAGSEGKPESLTGAHSQSSPRDIHRIPPPATTSSQATSLDAEKGSLHITSASIDGDLHDDDIPRDTTVPRASSSGKISIHSGQYIAPGSSAAASSTAASPRSPGIPPSPLSRCSIDFESHLHETHPSSVLQNNVMSLGMPSTGTTSTTATAAASSLTKDSPSSKAHQSLYSSSLMRDVTGTGASADGLHGSSMTSSVSREDIGGGGSNPGSAIDYDGSSVHGNSSDAKPAEPEKKEGKESDPIAVQNDVRDEEEEEEDATVEVSLPESTRGAVDTSANAIPPPGIVEPLQVEGPTTSSPSLASAGYGTAGRVGATNDNSITITTPTPTAPGASQPVKVDLGPEWENTFKGLLFVDGIDALGRPVVVLNADAVPPRMKASALTYVKAHLEPMVNSGDYVIVFTARKAKLPSLWIMGAYQSLPRPYRKNVQFVVLVRPSAFLRAVLNFMKPFVSKKAGRKIKLVDSLEEIGEATGGEVTMSHLGDSFLEDEARAAAEAAAMDGP